MFVNSHGIAFFKSELKLHWYFLRLPFHTENKWSSIHFKYLPPSHEAIHFLKLLILYTMIDIFINCFFWDNLHIFHLKEYLRLYIFIIFYLLFIWSRYTCNTVVTWGQGIACWCSLCPILCIQGLNSTLPAIAASIFVYWTTSPAQIISQIKAWMFCKLCDYVVFAPPIVPNAKRSV